MPTKSRFVMHINKNVTSNDSDDCWSIMCAKLYYICPSDCVIYRSGCVYTTFSMANPPLTTAGRVSSIILLFSLPLKNPNPLEMHSISNLVKRLCRVLQKTHRQSQTGSHKSRRQTYRTRFTLNRGFPRLVTNQEKPIANSLSQRFLSFRNLARKQDGSTFWKRLFF